MSSERFLLIRKNRNRLVDEDAARPVSALRAGGPGTTEPGPSYEELHPPRTREQILADHAKRQERHQRGVNMQSINKKLSVLSLQNLVELNEYLDTLREDEDGAVDLQGDDNA